MHSQNLFHLLYRLKMPSIFKNIKKFFSKPNELPATNPSRKVAKATPRPEKKTTQPNLVANPHMSESRAKDIDATIITQDKHQINFRNIDKNAIKIVKDLQNASYESYLVGGCVRDLLLQKRPKDFDVTTGAHPEQAHKVFSRSRLIGRRFKLLHVRFGRDLIEVATFRASHDEESSENQAKQADSGMILRDNVYGTIDQDAMRRDFTINALYLDVNSQSIYDFTNGYQDITARQIRMIGDPAERYKEDPVRMLRAIRFAAKLDFDIEKNTAAPIKELAPMLFDIAPARLFDEVLKLLQSGHGTQSLELLREYKLLETILPQTALALNSDTENARVLITNALINTDKRIKQRKSVSPGFLYATLLWPSVQDHLNRSLSKKRVPPLSALHEASSAVITAQVKRTSIPKRFSANIREIWELQLRLTHRPALKADQLIEHPRFRAAYDLLVLREKSGEDLNGISAWWTDYQSADADQKELLIKELNAKSNKAIKKKKPAKSNNKVTFEKFDVVEQVKPKPVKRAKQTTIETPEIVETAEIVEAAPVVAKKAVTTRKPKPKKVAAQTPSIATDEKAAAPIAQATPASAIDSSKVETKAETGNVISHEPSEQAPTTVPRRKIRRSRAKNDPRNK
jgi:poly(A) polymerase